MAIGHERDVLGTRIDNELIKGAVKKVLISPKDGWEGYTMRVFELDKGGFTPRHNHAWPHINYILGGNGLLHIEGKDVELEAGSYAYVPGGKLHQFKNIGDDKFIFICIVPEEGDV